MSHTILFVDDDPDMINVLKHALRKESYTIYDANLADQALHILEERAIDVVVSDENMPGTLGTELLEIICHKYPDTVRILLTGQATLGTAIRAINDGEIYRFLLKPCNDFDFVVTIRRAIEHKKLLSQARNLLIASRKQGSLLKNLEKQYPGITQVKRDATGTIVLDEFEGDCSTLSQKIDEELEKVENLMKKSHHNKTSGEPVWPKKSSM